MNSHIGRRAGLVLLAASSLALPGCEAQPSTTVAAPAGSEAASGPFASPDSTRPCKRVSPLPCDQHPSFCAMRWSENPKDICGNVHPVMAPGSDVRFAESCSGMKVIEVSEHDAQKVYFFEARSLELKAIYTENDTGTACFGEVPDDLGKSCAYSPRVACKDVGFPRGRPPR